MNLSLRTVPKSWSIRYASAILVIGDILALAGSMVLSAVIRYDTHPVTDTYHKYLQPHILSSLVAVAVFILFFNLFRLYKCAWRFAGLDMLRRFLYANTVGFVGLIVLQTAIDGSTFPRSVIA